MIEYLLTPQLTETLGWTLLHSLWQGAIFAILLALVLIALRSYSAQSRYVVAVGLLGAFFLTVGATFWQQWQESYSPTNELSQQLEKQKELELFLLHQANGDQSNEQAIAAPESSASIEALQTSWKERFRNYFEYHLPLIVTVWLLGILCLQLRFLGQLAYVQRLKHYGTELFPEEWYEKIEELEDKLRIQKKVQYLTSLRVDSPMVIGWIKPVILVPRYLLTSLTKTELYAVLAHELAHIRRDDFIINLMQTFLCNIFFFHPGIWWMSHRIDEEREHCCDDLAVAATGPAISYAKTLIHVSEFQLKYQENPALAMALTKESQRRERGGFSDRIRRLIQVTKGTASFREGFATACILMVALVLSAFATGKTTPTAASTMAPDPLEEIVQLEETPAAKTTTTTTVTTVITDDDLEVGAAYKRPSMDDLSSDESRIEALIMACGDGDLDFVKMLVESGIDVNGVGARGFTPLMSAANNEEPEVIKYLLSKGADVNQSYQGWTALIEAADEGSLECMKVLLNAGADVNYCEWGGGRTAITMAASEGFLQCFKLLQENGADINGVGASLPPLHMAAAEDKTHIIKYLITQGVDINKKDIEGRTALMFAVAEGQEHAAKLLIQAGADVSTVDANGRSAQDYAVNKRAFELLEVLGAEKQPTLHRLTQKGFIEKVEELVAQGADVNARDEVGRTPLHIASAENHNIDMKVLLDIGADVNARDGQGRTPLMYAAADGLKRAATLLIQEGADVHLRDADGMRAYEWARSGGNPELAQYLRRMTEEKDQQNRSNKEELKRRGRIQKEELKEELKVMQREEEQARRQQERALREKFHRTDQGYHLKQYNLAQETPALMEAVQSGSLKECSRLLKNGAPVNSSDATGQTPLMIAAWSNRMDIAKLLIEKGADVNRSSTAGLTALHYAALEDNAEIAQLLLQNKANVDPTMDYSSTDGNFSKEPLIWEYRGATPLLIAVESKNLKVLKVLLKAGANPNLQRTRKGYKFKKNRVSYLTAQ